eukprot:10798535-Alexandrium_andersonii.AAC.1
MCIRDRTLSLCAFCSAGLRSPLPSDTSDPVGARIKEPADGAGPFARGAALVICPRPPLSDHFRHFFPEGQ